LEHTVIEGVFRELTARVGGGIVCATTTGSRDFATSVGDMIFVVYEYDFRIRNLELSSYFLHKSKRSDDDRITWSDQMGRRSIDANIV
jgi:hypothetical protein